MIKNLKIAVLALNPGVDRIMYFDSPPLIGTLNRSSRTVVNQGSKGANVAIMLKTLGAVPEYFSFTGGALGALTEDFTNRHGVGAHFVPSHAGVRINTKIIGPDKSSTEFNEPGGPFSREELESLLDPLLAGQYDIIVATGSIPQGVEKSVYNFIIKYYREKGALTILDCDGEALKHGLDARPVLIKPNRRELAGILGVFERELSDIESVIVGCREIRRRYGCDIICTLEESGSVFSGECGEFSVSAAQVELRGFSGAGDTYLAAFIFGRYVAGRSVEEALAYASAAASAKVALEGTLLPNLRQIDEIFKSGIEVKKI